MVGQQGVKDRRRLPLAVMERELAPRPELAGAKIDHGLDHVQGSRVCRGLCPPCLADDHVDFGKPAEDHIARFQVVERFGHGSPGHGDRHVHHHSLVQGLQELARQGFHRLVGDEGHEQEADGSQDPRRSPACQQRRGSQTQEEDRQEERPDRQRGEAHEKGHD